MNKKRKCGKALFTCFCISLLMVVYDQVERAGFDSIEEAFFCVIFCTLSFYIWYGIWLIFKPVIYQSAGQEGSQHNSGRLEPKRIVATEIIDVQYKTKVKTNYPKAFIMSVLGRHAYGQMGGILGAASGSRLETIPKKVLFAVLYSDGTQRNEKVSYGSMRYKTLMRYVEE